MEKGRKGNSSSLRRIQEREYMTDILFTIIVAAALVLFWVMLYDTNRFVVRNHVVTDLRIRRGCRAVLLTDLHNKCYGKGNERLLAAIRGQKPDFILIAGDLLTANAKTPLDPEIGRAHV